MNSTVPVRVQSENERMRMSLKRISRIMTHALAWTVIAIAPPLQAAEKNAQVDVLLMFDTEDYLLPASDDATKRLADMLTQRGIHATFRVVGELARVLERRGRNDVISALQNHDIGYHTNLHSVHPTPAEYLAECGLLDGVAEFVRREKHGAADVRRIFGRKTLSCYCAPGASWACQALISLDQIGVSAVAAEIGFFIGLQDKPFWVAGVLNVYEMGDNYTDMALFDPAALEPAMTKMSQIVQRLRGEGGGVISIGYHPCDWVHLKFWDAVNFRYGANPPREHWKAPPQRPAEETERAFAQFAQYIDHTKSLSVRFITASQLPAIYADALRTEGVTEAELEQLAKKLLDQPAVGIDFQIVGNKSVSPADQFELLTLAVGDLIEGKQTKFPLVAKGILGPDSSPGDAARSGQTLAWTAFRDATLDVRDYLRMNHRVPARVFIGADFVSPADFLGGLAAVWCYYKEHHNLPDEAKLGINLAVLTERHVARIPVTPFTWSIHKPDLHIARIIEVARLQAWTLKPAIRQ